MRHYSFRLRKDPSDLSNQENCAMKTKRVEIREALDKDSEWVENLMHEALKPFYGGDHRAHTRRIFQTHIAGGQDQIGKAKNYLREIGCSLSSCQ